jgi:hypothetical protein
MKPVEIILLSVIFISFILGMRKNATKQIVSLVCGLLSLVVTYFSFTKFFGNELPVVISMNTALFIFALEVLFFIILHLIFLFFAPIFVKSMRGQRIQKGAGPVKTTLGEKLRGGVVSSLKMVSLLSILIALCGFFSESRQIPKVVKHNIQSSKVTKSISAWGKSWKWKPLARIRRFVLIIEEPEKASLLLSEKKVMQLHANRAYLQFLSEPQSVFFLFLDSRVLRLYADHEIYEIFFE